MRLNFMRQSGEEETVIQECGMSTARSEELEKVCAIIDANHCVERVFVSACRRSIEVWREVWMSRDEADIQNID